MKLPFSDMIVAMATEMMEEYEDCKENLNLNEVMKWLIIQQYVKKTHPIRTHQTTKIYADCIWNYIKLSKK